MDSMPLQQRLLTTGEVAFMLQVSRGTVYHMIHRGELPAVRVRTMLRLHKSDVERIVKRRRLRALEKPRRHGTDK